MLFVLLNPRFRSWSPNVYVPLGLAYVAAALEKAGHSAEIIDMNASRLRDKDLAGKLARADIVGITGMITEYGEVVRLAGVAKKANGKVPVILGGPLATALPEELLQASGADYIVVGEGEKTIVDLVAAIKNGGNPSEVKGIAYRSGDKVIVTATAEPIADLDTVPFPARHLLPMERYIRDHFRGFGFKVDGFGKIKSTNLLSSRGCPYSCTFCFKQQWGNKWRGRSAENILAEMEALHISFGINGFFFTDDTFVLDKKRVFRLCELIKEKGLNFAWYCNGRVNLMSKELLDAMYAAGCRGIAYGIESGNQQILDSMKKNITLDQIRQVVGWTRAAGLHCTGYFMIGMLGETKATIRETLAFARELNMDFYGFSLTTPLAGTKLYDMAKEAGLVRANSSSLGEWGLHVNANLTKDCSDADLAAFENESFKEFFLKKRFGRYYFLNPRFIKAEAATIFSLRNPEQARELAGKARSVIGSYFHRGAR